MLKRSILARTALTAALAATGLTSLAAPSLAAAQSYGSVDVPVPPRGDAPPSSNDDGYADEAPASRGQAYDNRAYDNRAYDNRADGSGGQHQGQSNGRYAQGSNRDYDRQMAEYRARRAAWERQNCQANKTGSTIAGAVVGGTIGALLGSALGGRGYRGTDAAIGGGLGAVTGAAIGNSSAGSCPQGYAYVPRDEYAAEAPPLPPAPPPGYYAPPPPVVVYEAPPPVYYAPPPPAYYGVGVYYGPRWGRRW
jgi:hypothetical protein